MSLYRLKYKICNNPITCPVQSNSSNHLTFWMDRLRRCGKNVNKHSRKNSKEIVCITKNMELIMHLREVHGSTYILAEGLSPSGLSFCHLYGFCAVSKAQASDKTRFPAQDVTWIRKLYKKPLEHCLRLVVLIYKRAVTDQQRLTLQKSIA